MFVPENNFVEVDFEKRIKIEEIAGQEVTVVDIGNMTTKFGRKNFALLEDGRWFYINTTLDHLVDLETPFNVIITKTTSESGTEYWTSNKKTRKTFNTVHITDLIGERILVYSMRLVNTKFGERVAIDFNKPDDDTPYSAVTNWDYLYDYVADTLDGEFDKLVKDPLDIVVIEKKSKAGKTYISYKNYKPETTVKTIKKPIKSFKKITSNSIISDSEVPFV